MNRRQGAIPVLQASSLVSRLGKGNEEPSGAAPAWRPPSQRWCSRPSSCPSPSSSASVVPVVLCSILLPLAFLLGLLGLGRTGKSPHLPIQGKPSRGCRRQPRLGAGRRYWPAKFMLVRSCNRLGTPCSHRRLWRDDTHGRMKWWEST